MEFENILFCVVPIVGVIGLGSFIYLFGFKHSIAPPSFEEFNEEKKLLKKKKSNKLDKKGVNKVKETTKKSDGKAKIKDNGDDILKIHKNVPIKSKKKDVKLTKELDKPQAAIEGWMTIPAKKDKKPGLPNNTKNNVSPKNMPIKTLDGKTLKIASNALVSKTHVPLEKESASKYIDDNYSTKLEDGSDRFCADTDYDANTKYPEMLTPNMQEEDEIIYKGNEQSKSSLSGTSTSNSDWEMLNIPNTLSCPKEQQQQLQPVLKVKPILKLSTDLDWIGSQLNSDGYAKHADSPSDNMLFKSPSSQSWGGQCAREDGISYQDEDDNGQWYNNYEAYFDETHEALSGTTAAKQQTPKQSPIQRSYFDEIDREVERKLREHSMGTFNGNVFEFADDAQHTAAPVYSTAGPSGNSSNSLHRPTGSDMSLNKRLGLVYENIMPKPGSKGFYNQQNQKEDQGMNNKEKPVTASKAKKPVANDQNIVSKSNPNQSIASAFTSMDRTVTTGKKKSNRTPSSAAPSTLINHLVSVTG